MNRRTTRRRWAILAAVLIVAGAGAIAAVTVVRSGSTCHPSPVRLSTGQVRPGASVTVSSARFACRSSYRAGKKYTLVLGQDRRGAPLDLGAVSVNRDGSFRADVRIPVNASPGEAYLIVYGSAFDRSCQDTRSCAVYGVGLTVLPAT